MKKLLLIAAGACMALSSNAAEPAIMTEIMWTGISPDGKWIAGENIMSYEFLIKNIETGAEYILTPPEDSYSYYSGGSGSYVSNVGIIAVCPDENGIAAVWDNGEVIYLPVKEENTSCFSNGITPDGTRVCGNVGVSYTLAEDAIMQKPVIWNRNEDGSWSDYVELPYPTLDITGRTPQYVLTNCISADGKTIAGMVRDYSGFIMQPIVFKEDAQGTWSYYLPNPELLNPNNLEFPIYPGEAPNKPDPEQYMTPEEYEAYSAALNDWFMTFEGDCPQPQDYMTEEEKAAYDQVMAEYEITYADWEVAYDAFDQVLWQLQEEALCFSMNNVSLSLNGRYYASTHEKLDFFTGEGEEYPVVLDLETGESHLMKNPDLNLITTFVNDDATVIAVESIMPMSYSRTAWICQGFDGSFQPLQDYVAQRNAPLYEWMKENMVHTIWVPDYEIMDYVEKENVWITGTTLSSADLSTMISWTDNSWYDESEAFLFSYIMPMDAESGISKVVPASLSATLDRTGSLVVNGDVARVEIYDAQGRMVFAADSPAAAVATGLGSGLYIVKASDASGAVTTTKASI